VNDKESNTAKAYARPPTRGDLRKMLSTGVACEVASHVAEMTAVMLKGWMDFEMFTIRNSENPGWTVFEPSSRQVPPSLPPSSPACRDDFFLYKRNSGNEQY